MGMIITIFLAASCSSEIATETESFVDKRIAEAGSAQPQVMALNALPANQNRLLAEIRRHTARFHEIEKALAEGYVMGSDCVYEEGLGAMGYHFVRPDLIGGDFDHRYPEALIYEAQEDGEMNLVAVEYIIVAAAWDAVNTEPPFLGNREFDFVEAKLPGEGLPFDNYQLHVWVWRNNPLGMYFPFNPKVSCEFEYEYII